MSVLCPQDEPTGNQDDRIGTDRITSEIASEFPRELWDDAAILDPAAFDRAASLEAEVRLAAVQCEAVARGVALSGFARAELIQEALNLRHIADEMQSAVTYL